MIKSVMSSESRIKVSESYIFAQHNAAVLLFLCLELLLLCIKIYCISRCGVALQKSSQKLIFFQAVCVFRSLKMMYLLQRLSTTGELNTTVIKYIHQ